MTGDIVNKVEQSGIITIDLSDFRFKGNLKSIDLKDFLFMEQILREKDFRQKLDEIHWKEFENSAVAIYCSVDTIIQKWAYMLLVSKLLDYTQHVYVCLPEELENEVILQNIQNKLIPQEFTGKRVVVKGCSDFNICEKAYVMVSKMLIPVVKSLMFGEPCSTVPVYKQPKKGISAQNI